MLKIFHRRYGLRWLFVLTTVLGIGLGITIPLIRRANDMHYRICYDMGLPHKEDTQICDRYDLDDKLAPREVQGPAYLYFVLISKDKTGYQLTAVYFDPSRATWERNWFPFKRCNDEYMKSFSQYPTRVQIGEFGMKAFGCELRPGKTISSLGGRVPGRRSIPSVYAR